MVIIANYGVGNLASVCNMLRKAGVEARVSESPADILLADRVILPGIGHFDHGMKMLNASGLREKLDEFALARKRPVLGICLGAQILGRGSEEGEAAGLGWLDMECQRFPAHPDLRVPHMGWSQAEMRKVSPLFKYAEADARYCFVHSYYMRCADVADVADVVGVSAHGTTFTSAVQRGNVFGVQFHPEESLRHGLAVMRAFAECTPDE